MSSFFSIHRPISLTTPIPSESSNKAFSSIFNAKSPSKAKTSDIIYTLSSTIDTLENAAGTDQSQNTQQMSPDEMSLRQAVTQAYHSNSDSPTHHLDIPAKTLHFNLQELAKNFRPFVPPPAPVPLGSGVESSHISTQTQSQAEAQPAPVQKSYITTLTIRETSYPNGQKTYKTHTTPIIEESNSQSPGNAIRYLPPSPQNQPFLGRMRQRQLQYLERLADSDGLMAISVKRQRKLKMKKHKYKKLMKRTKNLRRKLDRTWAPLGSADAYDLSSISSWWLGRTAFKRSFVSSSSIEEGWRISFLIRHPWFCACRCVEIQSIEVLTELNQESLPRFTETCTRFRLLY